MKLLNTLSFLIILLGFSLIPFDSKAGENLNNEVIQARGFFDQGEYSKGFLILSNKMYDNSLDSVSKARIYYELANFYEMYVGDLNTSLQLLNDIAKTNFKGDYELLSDIRGKIVVLRSQQQKYLETDNLFNGLKSQSYGQNSPEEIIGLISNLEELLLKNPDYYKKAEVYYVLGFNYMKLEKFRKANGLFIKSLKLKPAIDYLAPVSSSIKESKYNYTAYLAKSFSFIYLGIFLFVTIILFYRAKPWGWFSLKHIKPLAVLLILWAVLYYTSFYIIGSSIENFHLKNNTFLNDVVFLHSLPGNPGGQSSWELFLYGIYAIVGLYIFSIGMYPFKNKRVKAILIPCTAFLLFLAASSAFYVKNVYKKTATLNSEEPFLQKSFMYNLREIEPYMLTNPKAYPNLDVEAITIDVLLEWIEEYCPFDDKDKGTESTN